MGSREEIVHFISAISCASHIRTFSYLIFYYPLELMMNNLGCGKSGPLDFVDKI